MQAPAGGSDHLEQSRYHDEACERHSEKRGVPLRARTRRVGRADHGEKSITEGVKVRW